jgi:hypothetical protein
VLTSFLYGSSASSLRKQGNELAPDGISNTNSSYILHTRAQFAAQGTMTKCLQLS